MARPRKMTTEQMIAVVDSYYLTRAEGNEKLLKCSMIAAYASELGYQASGYDFARNMEVREHIERMKCYAEAEAELQMGKTIVPAYKNLDVAGFIRNNRETVQLAKSLTELDAHWKRIFEYAEKIGLQNKALMKEKVSCESVLKGEIMEKEKLSTENKELSALNNKLTSENRYLRKMLRTYLYPAIANEILVKENVLKGCDTEVSDAAINDMTEFGLPLSLQDSIANDAEIISEEEQLLAKMWELCDE